MTPDGINLIDKDNARCVLLRILEQVANTRSAYPYEHLDEVGTGDAEERHAGFACDSARKQRFTRTRRAYEQDTFRNTRTDCCELARILQEFDDLDELLLLFVRARHVLERDALLLFIV
ncbi:hypothetical protein D3C84_950100 [compost metagenome]